MQATQKIQKFVRPTRIPRQELPPHRTKNGEISVLFSVPGTGGRPTGSDPENTVGDQDIGNPGMPFPSWFQVAGQPGHCPASTRPPR